MHFECLYQVCSTSLTHFLALNPLSLDHTSQTSYELLGTGSVYYALLHYSMGTILILWLLASRCLLNFHYPGLWQKFIKLWTGM